MKYLYNFILQLIVLTLLILSASAEETAPTNITEAVDQHQDEIEA